MYSNLYSNIILLLLLLASYYLVVVSELNLSTGVNYQCWHQLLYTVVTILRNINSKSQNIDKQQKFTHFPCNDGRSEGGGSGATWLRHYPPPLDHVVHFLSASNLIVCRYRVCQQTSSSRRRRVPEFYQNICFLLMNGSKPGKATQDWDNKLTQLIVVN